MPPALAAPPSAVVAHARADDELSLAALMDLFEPEELEDRTSTLRSSRRTPTNRVRSRWSPRVTVRLGGARRAW